MPYLCAMLIKRPGRFPGNKKSDTMKPEDIYNGLEYTTREINRTFKIKVNGLFNGKKINTLVGVSGLIKLVGVEMANKFYAVLSVVSKTPNIVSCAGV